MVDRRGMLQRNEMEWNWRLFFGKFLLLFIPIVVNLIGVFHAFVRIQKKAVPLKRVREKNMTFLMLNFPYYSFHFEQINTTSRFVRF